jgi:hypothetical protein
MDQAARKLFAQRERERAIAQAKAARQDLRRRLLEHPVYEMEDPVAKWKREADEQDARFAEERRRENDDEQGRAQRSEIANLQAELGGALEQIANALGVLDDRLRKLEARRTQKTAPKSRPIALPDFVGPTHAPDDPSVRYTADPMKSADRAAVAQIRRSMIVAELRRAAGADARPEIREQTRSILQRAQVIAARAHRPSTSSTPRDVEWCARSASRPIAEFSQAPTRDPLKNFAQGRAHHQPPMSAFGANRTRRDCRNDVNDPKRSSASQICCDAEHGSHSRI